MRAVWETPAQLADVLLAFLVDFTGLSLALALFPDASRHALGGASQSEVACKGASAGIGGMAARRMLSTIGATVRPARVIMFAVVWRVAASATSRIENTYSDWD